jgi:hypothetical protein
MTGMTVEECAWVANVAPAEWQAFEVGIILAPAAAERIGVVLQALELGVRLDCQRIELRER